MDDQKMKIKIVVRPEDAHGAGHGADKAAEEARRARIRRNGFGLIALSALVALGAILAFVFMGNEPEAPDLADRNAPPAAADAAATSTRDGPTDGEKKDTAVPALAANRGAHGDGALNGETAAIGAEAEADDAARAAGEGRSASGDDNAVSSPALGRASPQGQEAGQTSDTSSGQPLAQAPSVAAVPTKPNAGVARAQLTSRVAGREPVDVMRSPVDVGPRGRTVYYFTEFRNLSGQSVSHRWEYDGQVVATVPFKIGGNRWRVYSSKQIDADETGAWRVSTVDRNDAVLSTSAFVAE